VKANARAIQAPAKTVAVNPFERGPDLFRVAFPANGGKTRASTEAF